MRISAAVSRTADTAIAAAEAADAARVDLSGGCDLAVAFVTPDHADGLEAAATAVEMHLEPGVLLGAVAQGIVGPREEVEDGTGVVVWAAHLGTGGSVRPLRAWTLQQPEGGVAVVGWPDTAVGEVTLVLADPFSFPAAELASYVGDHRPGQVLAGGLVTGGPGKSRFALDDRVYEDGAVGVVLSGVGVDTVVSQGCRPVGDPLTVTAAERNRILELGGEPAAARLQELLVAADADDRELLQRGGLHVGLVVDEVRDAYDTGDFLIRGVLGVDPTDGAVTIGDVAAVGQTIQFQVRDGRSADRDLAAKLDGAGRAAGTLLFTCNGRGRRLFGTPDHDVGAVQRWLGGPVGGAFCAGELGPVGKKSYLHGFTASLVVFRDHRDGNEPPGST